MISPMRQIVLFDYKREERGFVPSLRYTSRICVISKICGNPRPNRSKICVICEICVTFSQKIEQV